MRKATRLFAAAVIAGGVVVGLGGQWAPAAPPTREPVAGGRGYDLAFSTYFGGKMDCRGMTVDAQGNVYLAGSTWDAECPTTAGAYDRTFHGEADMAISKWSPEGKLLWSTLVGSPGHDRPYSVKVDSQGCVYAAGIGGVGMPVSPDAFQPQPLARTNNAKIPGEEYVGANGYIVKLSADGSQVLWGSYVGNNIECRDLAIDDEDNLYLTFGWLKDSAGELPASWFAHAYCKQPHAGRTPPGRVEDLGLMKVSGDGKKVFWATYIGGSGGNALEASLAVGPDHCPVVFTGTSSRDMPTTPGVFSTKPNSSWLGKFSADGSGLIFGTYLGAGKVSVPRTHDVALDSSGNIFATCCVDGGWPTTLGAFQRKYGGGQTDFGIVKLSPTGKLLACTYLGGSGDEINGPDTLSVGRDGSVLITSGWGTTSPDYPVTAGCFQPKLRGKNNALFSLLSSDLGTLLYSTYMGGNGANLRANAFGPDGSIWVAGHSPGPDWPLKNAYPNARKAGLVLAKFSPRSAAGLPGAAVPEGLGVNIHFTDPKPGELEMLVQAGVRWVRMDFGWDGTEPEKGRYDFSPYDRLLAALDKHHLRAMLILDYSNRHYDQGLSPASDEGRAAFARWAAAAARHFRGRGILWEMYNEPNIFFWRPKPDVKQYAKLALAVGKALREAEPGEPYVGPATSLIDFPFLEECFRSGLLEYWSAVTVHPYRQNGPETAAGEYARLRQLIERYAPQGKKIPILSGEWGYSSAWKDFDELRQGKMLARQWLTNLANAVPLSIWYDWHDDGQDPKEPEHHFGTVRNQYDASGQPVYEPKPAYLAARTLTTALDGLRFQKRVALDSTEDYALVFAKGDETRLAVWTTSAAPHAVRIPTAPGRFRVLGHTGQSLPPLTADSGGLRMTVFDWPQYLIPQPCKRAEP